jgi:hypothetical protein
MAKSDEYDVGYGRPPRGGQFKPGSSGNPSGRPKGSRSVSAILAKALQEKVVVTERGRRREISKLEAAAKQLANQAANGDQRAAKLVMDLLMQAESKAVSEAPLPDADARKARDKEVMAYLARLSSEGAER